MSEKREEEKREDEREGGESGEYVELLEGDIVDYVRTLPENVLELLGDLDYLEVFFFSFFFFFFYLSFVVVVVFFLPFSEESGI